MNVVFHLLHSLTLNLSYPSPLVSFMRPRLTGEINWECNFIFSGGLRETRWTRVKMSFTSEHFDLSFVPPPLSPLPLRKSMSTERLTLVRREMEAGSRSRTTSSSSSSGGKRYQPRAAWCCELYSVFLNSWAPSHTWFIFYACDVREAIISHIFCRARCYGESRSLYCTSAWKQTGNSSFCLQQAQRARHTQAEHDVQPVKAERKRQAWECLVTATQRVISDIIFLIFN